MPRQLPDWMSGYMHYTRMLESPDHYHMWAGIATIAGALQGKCWFPMGHFKWKPNFFIFFVARPGIATKSTTIGVGEDLLRQVPGIFFGPNSMTWQGLTSAFSEATTGTSLPAGGLYEHSSLTVVASELGVFLDPKNRELVDVLTDIWDGKEIPWSRRTKGDGNSSISNPWLNLIGATTPAWIEENWSKTALKGGFASRTIFVWGERKRNIIAYPARLMVEDEDQALRECLLEDLQQISQLSGPFSISPEAEEKYTAWYEDLWLNDRRENGEMADGFKARKQSLLHKLAMVISAARGDDMVLTVADLDKALLLANEVERTMLQIFEGVNTAPTGRAGVIIAQYVRACGRIPKATLWRKLFGQMSLQEFDQGLTAGMHAGVIDLQNGIVIYKEEEETK